MKFTIAVIPGDGIGPEVITQAKKALDAVAEAYDHIFLYIHRHVSNWLNNRGKQ
jgi:3-isopropylmalate dehydrogenase